MLPIHNANVSTYIAHHP